MQSPARLSRTARWSLLTLVATIVLAAGAVRATKPASRPDPAAPPAAVPVAVATAVRLDMPVRLRALGSVTAFNTVAVRPRVDGQVTRIAFREGQVVRRGDLLAEIDPRPFQAQLDQARGQLARDQAQLANARQDLTRYLTLLSQDSIAPQNVEAQKATVAQLEAAIRVDQAAIENARLNLTYARVTAPISGRLGLRLVDEGNVVTAASTTGLVVITQIEPIAVVFTLPEDALRAILPRIRAGAAMPVDVFDRSGTQHLAAGKVLTVDNQIDQTTGTVRVKAVFANRDDALFPSQFVNVQVVADVKRGELVVPATAVQQGPQGQFVYVVRDGHASSRAVTVASVEDERASIAKGLDAGEIVVVDGLDRLRNGAPVEVTR